MSNDSSYEGIYPDSAGDDVSAGDPGLPSKTRSWLVFFAGVLLCVLAPLAYIVQLHFNSLATPWYMPIISTVGVALMVLSLWGRRGVLRALVLIPFALLCGLEWYAVAVASRIPAYQGPAQPGRNIPRFVSALADGSPFTDSDLEKGNHTVLVFYRGRW